MASEDDTVKEEISQIWNAVHERVIRLAGGDPAKIDKDLSTDDVLAHLAQAAQTDAQAAKKHATIRSVFDKTLQCLSHLSGIVASGASTTFPPSLLCFNAINFVILAWQGYEGVYEDLAGLLQRCTEFLERLDYYEKGGMDAKLTRLVCQHLDHFVQVCDKTVALRHSKRVKFKALAGMFFLNEPGIKVLLSAMESLVDKETHLIAAQTFALSSQATEMSRDNLLVAQGTDTKVDILVEGRTDKQKEKERQNQRNAILKALAFSEELMDKDKNEPKAPWESSQRNFRNSLVPETGEWVFNEPEFLNWIKATPGTSSILAIEGAEGSGKSHLISTIIRKLRSRELEDISGGRMVVAYYYLEGESKEATTKTNEFDRVSKSLVWQLTQDASYQKSVANICQKKQDLDPQEILQLLLLENSDRLKMNASFFVIIDGFSEVGEPYIKFFKKIAAQPGESHVRLLISGKPQTLQSLHNDAELSLGVVPISMRNQIDVKKYIETRMNSMDALKDTKRSGTLALREKIRERLCKETRGDYFKLDRSLGAISSLDSELEIDRVLETAGAERSEQIKAEIDNLNEIRTPKEIAEINEIITWVLYGRWWFKPEQIDAALFINNRVSSIIPVDAKIKKKYTLFIVDRDGDVTFRSGDMSDAIPLRQVASAEAVQSSEDSRIHPAEVDIVRHFLNTVCPQKTYDKFGFEEFFKQRLNLKSSIICKENESDGQVKLAAACLKVLTEEYDDRHKPLSDYARKYFVQHLRASDLAQALKQLKSIIGPYLVDLFTKDRAIDALLWNRDARYELRRGRRDWLFDTGPTTAVLEWIKDSAVVSEVADQAHLREILQSSDPTETLLEPAAKRMAWHCFRQENPGEFTEEAFMFLFGYFAKVWTQADTQTQAITLETQPNMSQIKMYESKALHILGMEDKDSLWETQAAQVLSSFGQTTDAEDRCRNALQLDPENWRAAHLLAKLVTDRSEGVKILEDLIPRLRKDEDWMATQPHQKSLADMLYDLGDEYQKTDNFDLATPAYKHALELNPNALFRVMQFLKAYDRSSRWTELINFFETLNKDNGKSRTPLELLVSYQFCTSHFHDIILHATSNTGRLDLADTLYTSSIKKALELEDHPAAFSLRYFYGIVQNNQSEGEDRAVITWELAQKENFSLLPEHHKRKGLKLLTKALAPVYLRRARNANASSTTASNFLQRITELLHHEETERTLMCPSRMYVARYHQVQGDVIKAKQVARSHVELALEMLSDGDVKNDWEAYIRLVCVFVPLEDDEFAYAAQVMIPFAFDERGIALEPPEIKTKPSDTSDRENIQGVANDIGNSAPEDSAEEISTPTDSSTEVDNMETAEQSAETTPTAVEVANGRDDAPSKQADIENAEVASHSSDTSTEPAKPRNRGFFIGCDGDCSNEYISNSKIYSCRDCIDVDFDWECYAKLMNGTLKRRICDKSHDFMVTPQWDHERLDNIPRGQVPLGDKNITLEEWKTAIRDRYLL